MNKIGRNRTMASWRMVTGVVAAGVLAWTSPAAAGWLIDQVVKGSGARMSVMLQSNRMKTVVMGEDGKPASAFIMDLDAQTLTRVDFGRRRYFVGGVQEFVQALRGAQQMASGQMAQARKQMQETMKDMPPERRKMMEEMMRSRMPEGAGSPPAECPDPKIESRRTGEQATIAGYPAVRYELLADGAPMSDVWVAPGITAWRELDPQKLERFMSELAKAAPRCGPGQERSASPGSDLTWKLASAGYPVRTVDRSAGHATTEVVKAESRPLSPSEFQPPAGFAPRPLREMMGR